MKFGKNIGQQQQDDLFGLHYVDYKVLKKQIKVVVEHLQGKELSEALTANREFEKLLDGEIAEVNTCFGRRVQELLDSVTGLSETLPQVAAAGKERPSSASAAAASVVKEAEDSQQPAVDVAAEGSSGWHSLFQDLIRLLHEVDVLRKYAVWNAVGVVKILKKRRKQTSIGLEDVGTERAGWLSKQSFFSGSDFAHLHAAIESFGTALIAIFSDLVPSMQDSVPEEPVQCPICMETITDKIELPCQHRFCWKCFVLGPIAAQPSDEYRITHCPICRCEAAKPLDPLSVVAGDDEADDFGTESISGLLPSSQGVLRRFLQTYFPKGVVPQEEEGADQTERSEAEIRDVVSSLMQVILEANRDKTGSASDVRSGPSWQPGGTGPAGASTSASSTIPSDFFETLPPKPPQGQQMRDAQKMQWLQMALGDPLEMDTTMSCTLCCEPLCLEAVVTTPCKHHFHKVCISRLELPQCPLCTSSLPFDWFLPSGHPLCETGFRVVPVAKYRPRFPGGPSRGSHGYPLHAPPPASLYSATGMVKSYLHKIPPMGDGSADEDAIDSPRSHSTPVHLSQPALSSTAEANAELPAGAGSSASESSSEESHSDDEGIDEAEEKEPTTRKSARASSQQVVWGYTSLGKMRLCRRPAGSSEMVTDEAMLKRRLSGSCVSTAASASYEGRVPADLRNPQVLLIGQHL